MIALPHPALIKDHHKSLDPPASHCPGAVHYLGETKILLEGGGTDNIENPAYFIRANRIQLFS